MEPLVLALWGAVSVFVLWLALVSVVRKRRAASAAATPAASEEYVPDATPEEIMRARSMGLYHADEHQPTN